MVKIYELYLGGVYMKWNKDNWVYLERESVSITL